MSGLSASFVAWDFLSGVRLIGSVVHVGADQGAMSVQAVAFSAASTGLFASAILDRFFSDGDDDAGDDDVLSDGEMTFSDDDGDDFGDLDGMDDWDDPMFDEMDDSEGGEGDAELSNRLDELENEVASLSSTVNTVRSENTEISETVDDVEENVRKLLDIYEMVTRGINPFVDDVPSGSGGFDDGSLGLFDSDDGGTEEEELDESVSDADAEGFFDEDLVEMDEDDGADDWDDGDDIDDDEELMGLDDGDDGESDDEGKSFSELKAEYESGDADWADDEGESSEEDVDEGDDVMADDADLAADLDDDGFAADDLFDDDIGDSALDSPDPDGTGVVEDDVEFADDDLFDDDLGTGGNGDGSSADSGDDFDEPATESADSTADGDELEPTDGVAEDSDADDQAASDDDYGEFEFVESAEPAEDETGPYLARLPDAYVGDFVVMEWLGYLVDVSDVPTTMRALDYYERIEWISEPVASRLRDYLAGFYAHPGQSGPSADDGLSLVHHRQSLAYLSKLRGLRGGSGSPGAPLQEQLLLKEGMHGF